MMQGPTHSNAGGPQYREGNRHWGALLRKYGTYVYKIVGKVSLQCTKKAKKVFASAHFCGRKLYDYMN